MNELPVNVYEARVRSYMTDLYAVMYHGAYFGIFDDARIEVFRRLGYDYAWMQRGGWSLVIRRIECDFHAPAFMDDLITVAVTVPRLSVASLTIQFECKRAETLLAVGRQEYLFLDSRKRPVRLPEDMRCHILREPALGANGGEG